MSVLVESFVLGADGAPTVMVKDTIDVQGYRTRAGSRALEQVEPAADSAEVVERLLENGWKLTGKTNLHELAFGTTGINRWTGTPTNPWFPERIPGGSSSGSAAAVAAGMCDTAIGTDTGGSIRIPAACCGVFGLKPTYGRVSRQGVMPSESSLDCVGPLARSMEMLNAVMMALCEDFLPRPLTSSPCVGVLDVPDANPLVRRCIDKALGSSGLPLVASELPGMPEAYEAGMALISRESWLAAEPLVRSGLMGEDVTLRLLSASKVTDDDIRSAERVREHFTREVDQALEQCSVLALPTMPEFPPLLSEAADTRAQLGMTAFVRPFNLTGHPAISVPLIAESGLPVGLQLVAAKGADELLCAVASVISDRYHSNPK